MKRPTKKSAPLIWENTLLAFAAIRDRWARSLLTVMGVFIGVVIVISVASVLNGFRKRVIEDIEQWGTNNIYITRFPVVAFSRPSAEMRRRKRLKLKDAWALRDTCPAVEIVSPEIWQEIPTSIAKYKNREMVGPVMGGAFPVSFGVYSMELTEGRFFNDEENRRSARYSTPSASCAS